MNSNNYKLNSAFCSVPADDADKLLAASDGNAALLYLWLLRGRSFESFERSLNIPAADAAKAASKLVSIGLLNANVGTLPPPDNEMPEFTVDEIMLRSKEDAGFSAVLAEAEQVVGHTLSGVDLKTLFGIYSYLGLPADVIFELLHYCAEDCRAKYGSGRVPTIRRIEKEAFYWVKREILTVELADEFLKEQKKRGDMSERLRRSFGIRDRDLTASEKKYINSWLDLGFDAEAIEMAFDRTVTNIGQLKWPYMNKIILSWDEKNLRSPKEIASEDRQGGGSRDRGRQSGSQQDDFAQIKKTYDKLKRN